MYYRTREICILGVPQPDEVQGMEISISIHVSLAAEVSPGEDRAGKYSMLHVSITQSLTFLYSRDTACNTTLANTFNVETCFSVANR